jgi:hypothetical protein
MGTDKIPNTQWNHIVIKKECQYLINKDDTWGDLAGQGEHCLHILLSFSKPLSSASPNTQLSKKSRQPNLPQKKIISLNKCAN